VNPIWESLNSARKRHPAEHWLDPDRSVESGLRLEDRNSLDGSVRALSAPGEDADPKPLPPPRFSLGRLCITANAARTLLGAEVLRAINRHAAGDRGLLDTHDRQQNERALRQGGRLFSVYRTRTGQRFYVMVVDGASSHKSKDLVVPESVRLIPLPGYSPELNPEEHIWDEVREKAFPNLVLDRMELVVERLKQELSTLAAEPDRVRSITAWPWTVSLNVKAN